MIQKNIQNRDLGYLGSDFQYKLVKTFVENQTFFMSISNIVDQNMFTERNLRVFVGVLKDYYEKHEVVPSYSMMEIELRSMSKDDIEIKTYIDTIEKLKNTSSEGIDSIKDKADKFFKQQNLIKAINKIEKYVENGSFDKYYECEDIIRKALETSYDNDEYYHFDDNIDYVLSEEYRCAIPTGIGKIDETLEGGLGKGELGVILGPSSFGKVMPDDEIIVTPKGFTKNKFIKPGDYVIGKNGKRTKVINVYPHLNWEFYKITFDDGSYCECGLEHLWTVFNDKGEYKTVDLKYIKENFHSENFYIPLCEPVDFDNFSEVLNEDELQILVRDEEFLSREDVKYFPLKYRVILVEELIKNYSKFDGSRFYFQFNSEKPINSIIDVINSLGGIAFNVENKIYFILNEWFRAHTRLNESSYPYSKELKRKIVNIEPSRICNGQCIKVDANDELYLTRSFIVTHNTSLTTAMASYAATYKCEKNNYNGYKVIQFVFEDREKQIQRKHIAKIVDVEAKDLSKPDYVATVKSFMETYEDREMLHNNLLIRRLKSGEYTATDIARLVKKKINEGFQPDMIIVDYFECVKLERGETAGDSEWSREGVTMRKFESMANEFNIALWVPIQGTKDSLSAELVTMNQGGGSVKKIQIGHIIMSIARTMENIEQNIATIAILKNRAGKAGKVFNNVEFNNGTCKISTDNIDEYNMVEYNQNKQKKRELLAKEVANSLVK